VTGEDGGDEGDGEMGRNKFKIKNPYSLSPISLVSN
jgi:hypothetical protein